MALFTKEESLAYHEEPRPGKLEVLPVKPCFTQKDLSMAYSPGVANACLAIADDPSLANAYTGRGNLVAVVSNGTRRPRARQHRPPRGQAGHGRQERALQGVRGRERL